MKQIIFIGLTALAAIYHLNVFANDAEPPKPSSSLPQQTQPQALKEELVETKHSIKTDDGILEYKATTGTLLLKDESGKVKASVFFVAYTKEGVDDLTHRPVAFCFNGGPGSSSVWLHMGVLGPRRVELSASGCTTLPYRLIDNPQTILNVTDLIFIDPVSTGYSRVAPGEDAKQYHSVEGDIKSVAEFIRLYTTKFNRWASPKFIAGESYGTTRAVGLIGKLHDSNFMYMNGVILISSILNYQTIKDFSKNNHTGNDLPYILYLPSYAATAWYHKKLPEDLQSKPLKDVLAEAEEFAINQYSLALLKGDQLDQQTFLDIAKKYSRLTGISQDYVERSRLRVEMLRFAKELLRNENKITGRFDSRITGNEYDSLSCSIANDPSADAIFGGFTAMFNYYLRTELKWERDEEYAIIGNVWPWDYSDTATNQYLNFADILRETMTRNPQLLAFVASGYYDLATPYFAADYTVSHLGLAPSLRKNITTKYYDGGHMMYTTQPALDALGYDLEAFIQSSCPKPVLPSP